MPSASWQNLRQCVEEGTSLAQDAVDWLDDGVGIHTLEKLLYSTDILSVL